MIFIETAAGDFDSDGDLDANDVDRLTHRIRNGFTSREFWLEEMFDIDFDQLTNAGDLRAWVKDKRKTWFGDANLDGEFNSADLVRVFGANKYENDIDESAGWADGDWNGDGVFDSGDLVEAFKDGGYERGPIDGQRVNDVPEPSSAACMLFGLISMRIFYRGSFRSRHHAPSVSSRFQM